MAEVGSLPIENMMMKTLHTLLVALCLMATIDLSAQIPETLVNDARFLVESVDCETRTVCVVTQIRSGDGRGMNLAGQNYRLYYDASKAAYISGSGESLLPITQYSRFPDSFQEIPNADVSMFGEGLPFARTTGFLNYSIDLMDLTNGGVNLPASGEWVSTTRLCFEVTQEVIDEGSTCLSIVWGRMGLTDQYATAFFEVSRWVSSNVTSDSPTDDYND